MKFKKRVVVGVTGSLGSGKTTVAKIFARLGAKVLDADEITKSIYRRRPQVLRKILRLFGKDILNLNAGLDTKMLFQKAFINKNAAGRLNKIVHPAVIKILKERINKYEGIIIVDAPLLIESGFNRNVDYVVVIKCPLKLQLQRAAKNSRLSEADIRRRLACQLSFKNKKRYADFIIDNSGSMAKLKVWVKNVYSEVAK